MNIGIMCHDSWGGSSAVAIRLAGQLGLRGHNIHLFTLCRPCMSAHGLNSVTQHYVYREWAANRNPGELYIDWTPEDIKCFRDMVLRVVMKSGIDILNFHYAHPFAEIATDIKTTYWSRHLRVAGTFHGTDVTNISNRRLKNIQMCLGSVDYFTTVSRHHAALASRVFRLDCPPQVLPNFVDLNAYGPGNRLRNRGRRRRPRIAHISNFRPIKNPFLTVQFFLSIRACLDCEIWFVGDGPLRHEVMKRFSAHGLEDDVRYLGLTHNIADVLTEVDLLLVTSEMESFCLVALEAMASGVPVLAPRVGGLPELVRDGDSGLLFGSHISEEAVDLALSILLDQPEWTRMAKNAVHRAHKYDQDRLVGAYEEMYMSVVCARDPDARICV